MLTQNYPTDTNPSPTDPVKLVDLALSGECPGLLTMLLSPGLTENIYHNIEQNSKSLGCYN